MIFVTNSYSFIPVLDADAKTYINAVESADGQLLENEVKVAINNFVIGCKFDGIWGAIKASCILAGARTLNGALVPLVGSAPTNFNFVSADYNRKTGLLGNGTSKYLNTNRAGNADPQNNCSYWAFPTTKGTLSTSTFMGNASGPGAGQIMFQGTTTMGTRCKTDAVSSTTSPVLITNSKLCGISRASSGSYNVIAGGNLASFSQVSDGNNGAAIRVFSRALTQYSNARISAYGIGEAIDLAALDTRVSNLMTDLAAAIP
jgi:hypothetical protein